MLIDAIYENGVLRPLKPLNLPERTQVQIQLTDNTVSDPVLALLGAFSSEEKPLIDGIAVSEDPDLYLLAESLGAEAQLLHAWEIAPKRYREGTNGQPERIDS